LETYFNVKLWFGFIIPGLLILGLVVVGIWKFVIKIKLNEIKEQNAHKIHKLQSELTSTYGPFKYTCEKCNKVVYTKQESYYDNFSKSMTSPEWVWYDDWDVCV